MKLLYVIFYGIITFSTFSCHVTDRLKHSDLSETTQIPLENDSLSRHSKDFIDKKYDSSQKVQEEPSSVYLDDVLYALKHQEWRDEEKPCLDHIYRLLYSLQNFTLWAVWDWDSLSSEPQGLLFGNKYQLGNFDQCIKAPWSETHPNLKTKYCLAEVVLERTDNTVRRQSEKRFNPYQSALDFLQYHPPYTRALNELTWGACVPSECAPRTVERLLGVVLARSHLGAARIKSNITINEKCQSGEDHREYDGLFYAFFIVMGSLLSICFICTYLNSRRKESDPERSRNRIIDAFDIKENASQLLDMKKEGLEVFYGIRYLTICLIVLDHQIGIYNSGPISDGLTTDQEFQSPIGMLLIHNDLFVDTFFLLSGFLTMTNLAKFKEIKYILILKRYVRLIVAFAVVIFYISAVYPYTGSGPLWIKAISQDTEQCRKNWWLNLLMISNYVDTENICMVISWYIPCDFHFFVVSVLTYGLYKQWPKIGISIFVALTTGAIVVPAVITYIYQLAAVQLFTIDFLRYPRATEDYHIAYIKSHTRYAAYLVGFYSGWLFVKYSTNTSPNKLKQKWAILGSLSALGLMLVVMLYGSTFIWRNNQPIEGALYAALNRPLWACGVALLVFCCSFGHVPILKSFLSWYPWVPLSRLSYGLYLTHTIMITRNVFTARNPQHNDYFDILNSAAGTIFWGSLAALLLFLFAEAPANNLLSLCLHFKVPDRKKTIEELNSDNVNPSTSASSIPTSSTSYLQKNLPSNIQYSSKI